MSGKSDSPLGKTIPAPESYSPQLIYPIDRKPGREAIELDPPLPFGGFDQWTCYEFSWLDLSGLPHAAICQIIYGCDSPAIVESKSLKLYLGSFYNHKFEGEPQVIEEITKQLALSLEAPIRTVELYSHERWAGLRCEDFSTNALEAIPLKGELQISDEPNWRKIMAGPTHVEETLIFGAFRSLCPVTGQPDWATIEIAYKGLSLEKSALLNYLLSYRKHAAFHEECCERIFCDIRTAQSAVGEFEELRVICRFTRRGGISLTPVRHTKNYAVKSIDRDIRQ